MVVTPKGQVPAGAFTYKTASPYMAVCLYVDSDENDRRFHEWIQYWLLNRVEWNNECEKKFATGWVESLWMRGRQGQCGFCPCDTIRYSRKYRFIWSGVWGVSTPFRSVLSPSRAVLKSLYVNFTLHLRKSQSVPAFSKRIYDNPAKSVLKTRLTLYLVPVNWIDSRSLGDQIYVDDFLPFCHFKQKLIFFEFGISGQLF